MNDFNSNIMFTVRAKLLTNPFQVVIVLLVLLLLVFGIAIRNVERYKDVA